MARKGIVNAGFEPTVDAENSSPQAKDSTEDDSQSRMDSRCQNTADTRQQDSSTYRQQSSHTDTQIHTHKRHHSHVDTAQYSLGDSRHHEIRKHSRNHSSGFQIRTYGRQNSHPIIGQQEDHTDSRHKYHTYGRQRSHDVESDNRIQMDNENQSCTYSRQHSYGENGQQKVTHIRQHSLVDSWNQNWMYNRHHNNPGPVHQPNLTHSREQNSGDTKHQIQRFSGYQNYAYSRQNSNTESIYQQIQKPTHSRHQSRSGREVDVAIGSRGPEDREPCARSVQSALEHEWYDAVGCRDASVQTDLTPKTVSSWKILRTKSSENLNTTSASMLSDYVVMETRSLGFDASTQTQDAHLFRYSDTQLSEMVIAWQMITIFMPSTWYLILYVADQLTSVVVATEMCLMGEHWWCGLTLAFLILPSIGLNLYAYEQLIRPDIASVAPVNKWMARLLLCGQVAPHYLLGRKVLWCFRAWRAQSWPSRRSTTRPLPLHHKTPQVLWEQAKAETESYTTKWFHSLFESVPQLSVQTYIGMVLLTSENSRASGLVPWLLFSGVASLTSASAGLASVLSERAWERFAAATAIFFTLGSRVLVCGGMGTVHPALWISPVAGATILGFVTKVSESQEVTIKATLIKTHKYLFEAFIMACVCPPFNAVGIFSSLPYILAGLCFLTRDPGTGFNIVVFIMSILGQSIWLAVGFFVQ
ncbi:hypothetical protein Pcinc_012806 [Petrolisthes cinctipes]|uniref:XK-related protein n=1 Tax=Petrolisthes cinctipes TaxID=88211 RepID=A0AAE1KSY9_PETCI|nr:hypothetical protein Pcinc_012806 [Petrolisthes cinctipes]